MLRLGNSLLLALIDTQSKVLLRLYALKGVWGASFLPYALITLPLVFVTLLDWMFLMPLVLFMCLSVLFEFSKQRDSSLFEVVQPDSHWRFITPLCVFISVWGILMFWLGSLRPINVVTSYVLLLMYLMLPVVRFKSAAKRKVRLLPFDRMFYMLSGLIFFQFVWEVL